MNKVRSYKSYGESGDADDIAAEGKLPSIRALLSNYCLVDVFNCDEYELFYQKRLHLLLNPPNSRKETTKNNLASFRVLQCIWNRTGSASCYRPSSEPALI